MAMFLDRLDNALRYSSLHPHLREVFEFPRRNDPANLPLSHHDITGKGLHRKVVIKLKSVCQ